MPSVLTPIDDRTPQIDFPTSPYVLKTSEPPEPVCIPSFAALSSPMDHHNLHHPTLLAPGRESMSNLPEDIRTSLSPSPTTSTSTQSIPTTFDSPISFSHSNHPSLNLSMSSYSDFNPSTRSEVSSTSPSALPSALEANMPNTPLSVVSHDLSESHSSQASFDSRSVLSTDLSRRDSFSSSDVLHQFRTQRSNVLKLSGFSDSERESVATFFDRYGLFRPQSLWMEAHETAFVPTQANGLVMWAIFETHEQALQLLKLPYSFNVSPGLISDLAPFHKLRRVNIQTLAPGMKNAHLAYPSAFSDDISTPVPQDDRHGSHEADDSDSLTSELHHGSSSHKTPTAAFIRPSSSSSNLLANNNHNDSDLGFKSSSFLRPAVSMNDLSRVSSPSSYGLMTMNGSQNEYRPPLADLPTRSNSLYSALSRTNTNKPPTSSVATSLLGYTLSTNPPPPKPTSFRQGDWLCNAVGCGTHNFGRNMACIQCRTPRRNFEPFSNTHFGTANNSMDPSHTVIPRLATTATNNNHTEMPTTHKETDFNIIDALGGLKDFEALRADITAHQKGQFHAHNNGPHFARTRSFDRPTIPAANILTGAGGTGRGLANETITGGQGSVDFNTLMAGTAITNEVPQLLIPTTLGGLSPSVGTSLPQGYPQSQPHHLTGSSMESLISPVTLEPKKAPFHSSATSAVNNASSTNGSISSSHGSGSSSGIPNATDQQTMQTIIASIMREETKVWDFGYGRTNVVGRDQFISTEPNNIIRMWWPDCVPLPEKSQIRPSMDPTSHPPILNTGNKGPAEMQPGDWVCQKCDYHNWRRRRVCAKCYKYADNNNEGHKDQLPSVSGNMQMLLESFAMAARRGEDLTQLLARLNGLTLSEPPMTTSLENHTTQPGSNQGSAYGNDIAQSGLRARPSYQSLNGSRPQYPVLPSPFEPSFLNSGAYGSGDISASRRPSNLSVNIPPRFNGPPSASSQSEFFNNGMSPYSPVSAHSTTSSRHVSGGGFILPSRENGGVTGGYENGYGSLSARSSLSVPRLSMSSGSTDSMPEPRYRQPFYPQQSHYSRHSRQISESVEEKTPSPLPLLPAFMHEMVGGEQGRRAQVPRGAGGWGQDHGRGMDPTGGWMPTFGLQSGRIGTNGTMSVSPISNISGVTRSRNPSPASSSSLSAGGGGSNGDHSGFNFVNRHSRYQQSQPQPQSYNGVGTIGELTRKGSSSSIWAMDRAGTPGSSSGHGHGDFGNRSISSLSSSLGH